MKKLLLLSACLIFGIGTKAQIFTDVDRNLYRDYQPFFQPDPRLMQHPTSPKQAKGKAKLVTGLPDHVNNGAALWFPPIFNQVGGSCGASSRIGYMMTYEWNAFHGSNASQLENQLPPHFEYPFSYDGLSKDQMAIYVGYPDGVHYGGSDVSSTYGSYETTSNDAGWMQGYDNWYNAMSHRITAAANFPKNSLTEEGAEAIKWWLFNHNGDASWPVIEDDNGQHIVGGICGLGCGIARSATSKIGSTAANKSLGVVGKIYLSQWNTDYVDHAVTLVGYDDRIEFDLDGNGTYGESNNQLGQNEKGAWIVANSWGASWGNNGFFYVPYAMAGGLSKQVTTNEGKTAYQDRAGGWYPEIYYLRQNYKPTRTMKVTMQYSKRSEISVVAGASQDTTSTQPEKEYVFRYINYTGDGDGNGTDAETPLLGRWADGSMHSEPMEFGIDLTDLSQDFDVSKPIKYFLTIHSKSSADGIGQICTADVIDYLFDSMGTTTPFPQKNVQIQNQGKSTVITVVVGGEAINPPVNLTQAGNTLSWGKPQGTAYQPTAYVIYQDGKEIARTTNTTYQTTTEGTYAIKALYTLSGTDHLSAFSNSVATAQTAESAYDNVAQTFSNGGFLIPNITKSSHSQFTIELWLKPSSIKDWNQQIGGPWGSFLLHANSDGTMYFGWDTYNRKLTSTILHNGQWTHLAVVVDKNTATLYANGESQGSVTSTSYSGFPAFSNGLLIGYASGSSNAIYGDIDEVRVWDVARSAQDIKDNETRPIASPATTQGLLAYLKMNTITVDGTEKLQDCAHGNHATFINANHSASTVEANTTLRHHDGIIASLEGASEALKDENIKYALKGGTDVASFSWTATHATPASTQASEASFVFNEIGEQTVTLKVTSLDGITSTLTKTVNVNEQAATADFEITNAHPKCSERTSFLAKNKAPGCTYQWTMQGADVTTATTQHAAAVYSTTGDHDVTLTVTTPDGKKLTKTAVVTVTASKPEIAYAIDSISHVIQKGSTVILTDASKYDPTSWKWRLMSNNSILNGEGSQVSLTPTKAGAYTLFYQVSNEEGEASLTESRALVVCNAESGNGLNFTTSSTPKTLTTEALGNFEKAWTIDLWMKPATFSNRCNGIEGLDNDGNEVFSIITNGQGAANFLSGSNSAETGSGYFIAGEWHHYAITMDAGTLCFYRDSVLIDRKTGMATDYSAWKKLQVGGSAQMNACVDELRVWNQAMPQADIKRYVTQPLKGDNLLTAKGKGLLAYYDFNQNDGIDVADQSGNGKTAHRANFGPGGDAWSPSKGVFALDFSAPVSESLDNHGSVLNRSAYRVVNVSDEETSYEYGPAEKAFDEDPSTLWHTAYHDGQKPYPHSVTIDKTTNDVIEGMQLYFARKSSYRAVSAKVEQSADNITWETLDENHAFFDMERPAIVFNKPCTQRYLRITFLKGATNSSLMAINDISFYGKKEELSGKASVTLRYESVSDEETNGETAPGRYAVDNDVTTFWHSHYTSSVVGYPHSITLSQPTGSRIDVLTLVQRDHGSTSSYYDAANMVIYAGDDPAHLDSIETIRIPFYIESTVRLPIPIDKKYFQLKFTGSQYGSTKWLAICEIKAYQLSGEETGILNINGTTQKEADAQEKIYDLMGRLMGKNPKLLPPGIYIRDGKKFVIK